MFGHRSFLIVGGQSDADIVSLVKNGYECVHSEFSFAQGIDDDGKVQTGVLGGTIHITLSMFPDEALIRWGIKSKEYRDGMIVTVDPDNKPLRKTIFRCLLHWIDSIHRCICRNNNPPCHISF